MLRAIIFDFDGVLANSEPLHFRVYCDVLAAEGITLTEHDYYTRYLGYDDVAGFTAIGADHGRHWTPAEIARLVRAKMERLELLERDVSVLFPGAADATRRAAAAVPIAIASGALSVEIRRVLDRENLTQYFSAIVAAEDSPASKPAPEPYLEALTRLTAVVGVDLAAGDCVAVEDSHWGLVSARAAGLKTVAVAQTYDRAVLAAADLVIDSIDRLDLRDLARICSA